MASADRLLRLLRRSVQVERAELVGLTWSFLYFFCLLAGYYILRPVRDEMGVASGVPNLHFLFTTTFLIMAFVVLPLHGYVTSRFPRRQFVPWVYGFFILNLVLLFFLFRVYDQSVWIGRIFFVWVSIFNLFVVSVFWSFMADIWNSERAARLFGVIAAGGSVGAATGPLVTALLVDYIGVTPLLLVSAGFLSAAVVCVRGLLRWQVRLEVDPETNIATAPAIGGTTLAGLRIVLTEQYFRLIAVVLAISTFTGSTLYFARATLVAQSIGDPVQRTTLFAYIDLSVNLLTVAIQIFVTSRLIKRLGVGRTISILPFIAFISLLVIAAAPWLLTVALVMIAQRAIGFGIASPSMNVLFTVVRPEAKYKAKHFIDTVCYRLGDVIGAWTFVGLTTVLGFGISAVAGFAASLAIIWVVVALQAGKLFDARRQAHQSQPDAVELSTSGKAAAENS